MEELMQLKQLLHQGNVSAALVLVEELEEMSKSDKLNKIFSYAVILLSHLIKQSVEKRTTKSWDVSIRNSVKHIQRTDQCYKASGTYLSAEELLETLQDAYGSALDQAALEAFGGIYEPTQIAAMTDQEFIVQKAFDLIVNR